MEQNPSWQANNHSANRQFPRLLWNLKFHYRFGRARLVPVLSQMKPVHTLPPYFPEIHSSIIHPSMPMFLSFRFSKICMYFSSLHACYMSRLSHTLWLGHHNSIWRSCHVMKIFTMQSSPPFRHFLPLGSKCGCVSIKKVAKAGT
jgi:hypothetical protein